MWVERLAWDAIIAWEAYSFGEIFLPIYFDLLRTNGIGRYFGL